MGNTRIQFCMKFFLVGVIFLVFDVEISLILPIPFRQTFLLLFFIVLLIGTVYEWYYGGLDWLTYVNGGIIKSSRRHLIRIMTNSVDNAWGEYDVVSTYRLDQMVD